MNPWRRFAVVPSIRRILGWGLVYVAAVGVVSLASSAEGETGPGAVAVPCPPSPNCVSSLATDDEHRVAPLRTEADWEAVRAVVEAMPRTQVTGRGEGWLVAEARSFLFRFVDDLVLVRREDGTIDVRSSSRTGYSDMGVNRRRVERLRAALAPSPH